MKKNFLNTILGILVSISFFAVPLSTVKALDTEHISLFESEISQDADTTIHIKEAIHYFFPTSRHGIYWETPVNYKVAGGFQRPTTFHIQNLYYYDDSNPQVTYSNYEKELTNGYVRLKIGDADTYISGKYTFVIEYTLKNATNYFDDHDELYLNLIGPGWDVPILSANSTIQLPGKLTDSICYTGAYGEDLTNCKISDLGDNTVKVEITKPLNAYEGYTTVISMPKGTLDDTTNQQRLAFLLANIGILLPIPVLILCISLVKKKGKNKKITIMPHYEAPKDMNPILAGTLYKKTLQNKFISAEIINLAIAGYITIKQIKKNQYELIKSDKDTSKLTEDQVLLLNGLFKKGDTVNTKKIDTNFYTTVINIRAKISSRLFKEDLHSEQRKKFRGTFITIGTLSMVLSFALITIAVEYAAIGWFLGVLISGLIALISASGIDLKSINGNEKYYELLGLKMYINTAEKHRIEFHDNPEKFRGVFESLLPYAMIFGLEKKWADEFKDIYKESPDWYQGNMSNFNTYMLTQSMNNITRNIQTKSNPPGSSSSGFRSSHGASGGSGFSGGSSGGGFGGSGGGSW